MAPTRSIVTLKHKCGNRAAGEILPPDSTRPPRRARRRERSPPSPRDRFRQTPRCVRRARTHPTLALWGTESRCHAAHAQFARNAIAVSERTSKAIYLADVVLLTERVPREMKSGANAERLTDRPPVLCQRSTEMVANIHEQLAQRRRCVLDTHRIIKIETTEQLPFDHERQQAKALGIQIA